MRKFVIEQELSLNIYVLLINSDKMRYKISYPINMERLGKIEQTMHLSGETNDPRMISDVYGKLYFIDEFNEPTIYRNNVEISIGELDDDLKSYNK